jgi:Mce-associated membrane protein
MSAPDRPGWYADPLKPTTQERRWNGTEWTDDTREASVPVSEQPAPPAPELVEEVAPTELVEQESAEPLETEPTELPDDDAPDEDDVPGDEVDGPVEPRSTRATIALVVAIVLLIAVALIQVAYLWGPLKDDPTVSASRPVLLSTAAERSAVDVAAKAAVAFSARSYETYDKQVDEAAAMMTTAFAKQFRQTTDDTKPRWLTDKLEVTAEVVAQGVMTATDHQVEAIIFLNQFTTRPEANAVLVQFKLKVTLIEDDQGWLVSDVDLR